MKKMLLYAVCVVSIAVITVLILYFFRLDTRRNISFLKEYGWITEKNEIEIEEIIIPEVFDDVYINYNRLQKQSGLDLEPYKGKKAVRYTYVVLNYPYDVGEEVRANIICVKGKPIAGDIMTLSLNGFMHSLKFPVSKEQ